MDLRLEISLEDVSERFFRITYESNILFNGGNLLNNGGKTYYLLVFGIYPDKNNSCFIRLVKVAIHGREISQ